MTDDEILIRANRAAELLDNPILSEALQAYETEITEAWKNSPLRDAEGREKLRQMLEAHRKFTTFLVNTMESGKLARVIEPTARDRVMSLIGRR